MVKRSPAADTSRGRHSLAQKTFREGLTPEHSALSSWRLTLLAASLIVLAAVAAYQNSFAGAFVYDDLTSIVGNRTIRRLWPIGPVLSPPCDGETVGGRPLLNLSLAINYALGGLDAWGYHATNLAIHVAAALLLLGILRRTFLTPPLRNRFGRAATPLALAGALLWTVHPLHTESVTYIAQRAESLAGLFYLLTLYGAIRGAWEESVSAGLGTVPFSAPGTVPFFAPQKPNPPKSVPGEKGDCPPRPTCHVLWYAVSVLACLLGMATKEVLVTAPLIVLLYDRTFLSGSFQEALRRRWGLYVGLAATWGLLIYLVLSTGLIGRQPALGAPDPWSYARTQPGVILHYLRLSVWPHPLCFDYGWPVANTLGQILPGATAVGLLVTVMAWGLVRHKAWGFLGAWFLLILAPTSSVLPLRQLVFEHRMYLPLAAVAVAAVAGGYAWCDRLLPRPAVASIDRAVVRWAWPAVVWAAVVLSLGAATVARNRDYQSTLAIFQDSAEKRPNNPDAHVNLGAVLADLGKTDEAIEHYLWALRLKSDHALAHDNLGIALAGLGRHAEALEHYRQALRLQPTARVHHNMGTLLLAMGSSDEAIEHFQEALRLKPDLSGAEVNLGFALAGRGKTAEALEHYHRAWQLQPDDAKIDCNLGEGLANLGRRAEAVECYRAALRLKPDYPDASNALGDLLSRTGKTAEAIEHYRQALRLRPDFAEAHNNLANALAVSGKLSEAIEHYQQTLRLRPDLAETHNNLANALAMAGRVHEAIEHYDQMLRMKPDFAYTLSNLAWLLATRDAAQGGNAARAIQLAQRMRELKGKEDALCLDTLAAAYASAGQFSDAVSLAERALQLAESTAQAPLAKAIRTRLELYRAGRPYREGAGTAAQPRP